MRTDLDEAHDRETSSASGYSRYDQYGLYQRQGTGPANRVPKEGYDVEEYQPAGDMRMSPTAPSKTLQSTPDLKLTCRAHHPDGAGRNHGTAESCLTRMHEVREDRTREAGPKLKRITWASDTGVRMASGPTCSDHLCLKNSHEGERMECTEWLSDWTGQGKDEVARQHPILDPRESHSTGGEGRGMDFSAATEVGEEG